MLAALVVLVATLNDTIPPAAPVNAPAQHDVHPEWADMPEQVQENLKCLAENEERNEVRLAEWHSRVSPAYRLRLRALAGVFAGGDSKLKAGAGTTATSVGSDYGYSVAGAASLGFLTPLQIDAAVRYMGGQSATSLQIDATAALAFRTYGNHWVDAGYAGSGAYLQTWDAHCQLRRIDRLLFGGAKLIRETISSPGVSRTIPALQLGFASHHLAGSAVDFSVAGLWSPSKSAYGGQLSFGASKLLIAIKIPVKWIYTNMSFGGLFGPEVADWWATLDLGLALEL